VTKLLRCEKDGDAQKWGFINGKRAEMLVFADIQI
jgi:hypothetical protein